MFSSLRVLAAGLVVSVTALAGCGDQYGGRQAVSGTVTLAGKPLDDATIIFTPVDGQETSSGRQVVKGEYQIDRKDGLLPGKYLVRITAGDGRTVANEEEAAAPGGSTNIVSVDRIPPDWNVNSTRTVEVTTDGDNEFDFDIPEEYVPKSRKR